jgi:hypothetical protein
VHDLASRIVDGLVDEPVRHLADAVPHLLAAWRAAGRRASARESEAAAGVLLQEALLRWCDAATRDAAGLAEGTARLFVASMTAVLPPLMCVVVLFCFVVEGGTLWF